MQDEELMKKPYTYDLKGELLPVKGVNVDSLARECNFEMRYNTRKAASQQKGLYSFEMLTKKLSDKPSKKDKIENKDEEKVKKKKGRNKDSYLETGKDLKKAFSTIKLVVDPI